MLVLKNLSNSNAVKSPSTTLFHLVDLSPWPFVASQSLFIMLSGAVVAFHGYNYGSLSIKIGFLLLLISASLWWRDVTREGFQGQHTAPVTTGIKMGFSLFIVSEIFLFIAFFWALFHSSLVPNIELGNMWPPLGIEPINPWVVPLLNAIILLSSGVTVTWAHHAIIASNYKSALYGLIATIVLAVIFTLLMVAEYYIASFDISDSVYGSCFYMLTGLHGTHIIVAIIFLLVSIYRLYKHHFSNLSFLGAELGILYYHFVDVVFLFVFGLVYWWSSGIELSLLENSANIHALTPLLFLKNSYAGIKKFYKKFIGIQIRFLYFCATSTPFFVLSIFLLFFCFLDINIFTTTIIFGYHYIFSSIIACSLALKLDFPRSFLSQASGISEIQLVLGLSFSNGFKLGAAIGTGLGLTYLDKHVTDTMNMNQVSAYAEHRKKYNLPMDAHTQEIDKVLLSRVSHMTELSRQAGKMTDKIYSFKDLTNLNKKP